MSNQFSDGIEPSDLDECWCCGCLHDSRGLLCPDCDDWGCPYFGGECQSGHNPVLPDGGNAANGTERIGVGECDEHGAVTEDDGATISFPVEAECHCGRELDRATVATREEVERHV